jgi:hypothetical protein
MIVRVMTEGQYELEESAVEALKHEDEALLAAVHAGDARAFSEHLGRLLVMVRQGHKVAHDVLRPSDLVVPPPDLSVREAQQLLEQHQI